MPGEVAKVPRGVRQSVLKSPFVGCNFLGRYAWTGDRREPFVEHRSHTCTTWVGPRPPRQSPISMLVVSERACEIPSSSFN